MLDVEWQWNKTQYNDADWIENANPELDQTFINDLDRVINYQMDDDYLVLQLNNNAGLMYFIKKEN